MRCYIWDRIWAVAQKDLAYSWRDRADTLTMFLFALTVLISVSMTLGNVKIQPEIAAALLWVIMFLAMIAGMGQTFRTEGLTGTLLLLRLYGNAQAVLLGKLIYVSCQLFSLAIFIVSLFLVLFDISLPSAPDTLYFLATVATGLIGFAVAGTFIAALSASAAGMQGSLFAGLLLPLILPVLLPAISLTAGVFNAEVFEFSTLLGMLAYDGAILAGASILFDYIWEEGL